jgi:hypothetical protein
MTLPCERVEWDIVRSLTEMAVASLKLLKLARSDRKQFDRLNQPVESHPQDGRGCSFPFGQHGSGLAIYQARSTRKRRHIGAKVVVSSRHHVYDASVDKSPIAPANLLFTVLE